MSLKVSLSKDGESLAIVLPNQSIVTCPASAKGMNLLVHLLKAQRESQDHRMGTEASPVQDMVDEFLRNGGKVKQMAPIRHKREPRLVQIAEGVYKRTARLPADTITLEDLLGLEEDDVR